jgi:hypothetical protein
MVPVIITLMIYHIVYASLSLCKEENIINTTDFYIYCMKSDSRAVNIDFELWKKAEVLAIDEGITITEFIEDAIREKIDKDAAQKIQK